MKTLVLVVLGSAGLAAVESAAGASPPLPLRLHQQETLPAALAGDLERLSDGARLSMIAGESLAGLAVGAYRAGEVVLVLRNGDDVVAHAQSLTGLPVAVSSGDQGISPWSLPILVWRFSDGIEWPWVDHGDLKGGLYGLTRRLNGLGPAWSWSETERAYVDRYGKAIALVPVGAEGGIAAGDLVVAEGRVGVLVEDSAPQGVLDPGDLVIAVAEDADMVRLLPIGALVGQAPITGHRRDAAAVQAAERPISDDRQAQRLRPFDGVPTSRAWLAVAGMVLICWALLRRARRARNR